MMTQFAMSSEIHRFENSEEFHKKMSMCILFLCRLTRIASDDPQLHCSRRFEYEKAQPSDNSNNNANVKCANFDLSPTRLQPSSVAVRGNIVTTADVMLTADSLSTTENNNLEDKGHTPQIPLIVEPGITVQNCTCPAVSISQSKPSGLQYSKGNSATCLTPDDKLSRKLYPNCDSPVHRAQSNGYIPISYTDNINKGSLEKVTPMYLRDFYSPHSDSISSISAKSSPIRNLTGIKYLDESSSDNSSIEDQLAASPVREALTTNSSTNGDEDTTSHRHVHFNNSAENCDCEIDYQ
mgnify:CR=1 FL=1